ncbi:MAG TPA: chloride channel protein [Luteolibacter sp.]|nr:chloride channel protein [Luteolibacter sp.]
MPFKPLTALKWLAILAPVAVLTGSASAFFLWSLDAVTRLRFDHPWLLYLLPLGGVVVGWIYHRFSGTAARGNNLIIDEIHQPGAGVPRRLAPLILLGTLITHLFGGSAGREGTAVQMGGGIAATLGRALRLNSADMRLLLMSGVAAGFGSVFGTPIAGAIFAVEVLVIGRIQYRGLIPCLIASWAAHGICMAWGTHHLLLPHLECSSLDLRLVAKAALAAVAFGGVARLFVWLCHSMEQLFKRLCPPPCLRPALGGAAVIGLCFVAGSRDYLGLGVLAEHPDSITLPAMFTSEAVPASAWLWKLLFTAITLGAAFKGGEVTPLFFIGAALGNAIAITLGAPIDLFAALGLVAIFAAATKTPLASCILGMELFGASACLYLAAACLIAYLVSGPGGIYTAQRKRAF